MLLDRHKKIAVAPFEALIHEAGNNIFVQPQDTVYVYKEPQTFLALARRGSRGRLPSMPGACPWRRPWQRRAACSTNAQSLAGYFSIAESASRWCRSSIATVRERRSSCSCDLRGGPARSLVPVPGNAFPDAQQGRDLHLQRALGESTKFLNHVRLLNATVQDPINTAISGYILKNLINGTGAASSVIITGTPTTP